MAIVFEPIEKQNVADVVIKSLLDQMLSGQLKAGEKLPGENEISSQLGIGRNSVREAMKVLQTLGIVERRQGDGSYIVESYQMPFEWLLFPIISRIGNSQDLVQLRRVLEIGVTELVIENAAPEDFEELNQILLSLERLKDEKPFDAEKAVGLDISFHVALAKVTKNDAVVELSRLIMKLFEPSMKRHLASMEGFGHARDDHREYLKAIVMRDRDAARRSVVNAFEHWKEHIG